MAYWIRFELNGRVGFGTLLDGEVSVYDGDMFSDPARTGAKVPLDKIDVLVPSRPSKFVCLWNNSRQLAARLNASIPLEPLYFFKASTASLANGAVIRAPRSYSGKVAYEGELGVVIGKLCRSVSERDAPQYIFGYTCVNDVTAVELINRDNAFPQWARAKSFDTFGPFGPAIATDLDPSSLVIRTLVNGKERQNYMVDDMVFSPHRLVSLISQDLTLLPGDIIACGTSVGVGSMRPGDTIEVAISGIGSLVNRYE